MRAFITDIARAVAFLSRLPVPAGFFVGDDGRLTRVVRAFSLAGLIIALPQALAAAALMVIAAPDLVSAVLVLFVLVLTTGSLHEDGLADTADGLGAGGDRERALAVMKDSRTGVYGVVALVLTLALRAAALAALFAILPPTALVLVLFAAACLSRAAMVWHWHMLPSARTTGVAAAAGRPDPGAARLALASGIVIAGSLIVLAMGPVASLVLLAAAALALFSFTSRTRRRLGGHTGDTIGACQQIVETACLVCLALLV
ncbi:adenosylcobinamide-GDP ribazoletransferase [Pararhizobium haloflavum]|uniref:adenosylcobinamide-GDP ribazoletransferase n=1 Tax=Pararhizobium haloflavum TaxID=2037914 RepID=UPI000C193299|nr:adenosylcobinamide-GDP ribazoletransferase [Pararhizobium haloflavum]